MANLYRLEATMDALAHQFGVELATDVPVPSPVRPGEQGLIVRGVSGKRSMHVLKWGFPRPGRDVEPSTVNLVADLTNFMWDGMVPDPRYRSSCRSRRWGSPTGPRASRPVPGSRSSSGQCSRWRASARGHQTGAMSMRP